jgi:hypothetical protein
MNAPGPGDAPEFPTLLRNQAHEVLKATAAHKNGNRQALRKLP